MGEYQKRLEYQLYLARENPEPTYDVSKCDLAKIPQGCYSLCKVLRKKILRINNNKIKEINSNGNMIEDLTVLIHIYAQFNEISKLPNNITSIQYLQILDVSHNQLSALPSSMGDLVYLQKLYLQYNNIKIIPTSMLTDKSALELIDITENKDFSSIPSGILNLPKLKRFSCTTKYLKHPSQDVCEQGVMEIMKVICKDAGVKMNSSVVQRFCGDGNNFDDVDSRLVDSSLLDYESFKQSRLQFLESLENKLQKTIFSHDDLRDKAAKDKIDFLNKIANEEIRITKEIGLLHLERDLRREQLINDVKAAESDAKNLIEEIMTVNKACKQQETILDELEKDTNKKYQVYQEDYNRLRKEEILTIMSELLISQESTDELLRHQRLSKVELNEKVTRSKSLADDSISELLKDRRDKQYTLCSELENQETRQKLAFQQLQLEKDIRTLRIKQQISSVESELMILSQVEQNKRTEKNVMELKILNERRKDLVKLLQNLMEEKYLREKDLMNRLMEIEKHRKDDQIDFWLVQYQRLLDTKPPDLLNESYHLEALVLEAINRSNSREYLPFIQRRNITWEQLKRFQTIDLQNIGIHDSAKISDILDSVLQLDDEQTKKNKSLTSSYSEKREVPKLALSSSTNVLTSHREIECCICLVEETTILFLECGHICCCEKCSKDIKECPLCRQSITRFIKLLGV